MFGSKIAQIVSTAVQTRIDLAVLQRCTPAEGRKQVEFDSEVLVAWRDVILADIQTVDGVELLLGDDECTMSATEITVVGKRVKTRDLDQNSELNCL